MIAALFRRSMGFLDDEAADLYVSQMWQALLVDGSRVALDAAQFLVEADERLDRYYRRIWETCSPDQKLVLLQIAEEGFVNEKSSRVVRLLMARGLVTRRPNIRLMNETFRRFILSDTRRADAAAAEDQSTSTWDSVRWPFLIMLMAMLAFLFTTQHELFNTTLGVITALAAGIPVILKMASLFGEKRAAS